MLLNSCLVLTTISLTMLRIDAFFLLEGNLKGAVFAFVLFMLQGTGRVGCSADDKEPFFFCFKICPLYCSPRRSDEDASALIYTDDDLPPFIYDHGTEIEFPYRQSHSYFCKPPPKPTTTTSTTQKTTTEEPTFICQLCEKKCIKKSKK